MQEGRKAVTLFYEDGGAVSRKDGMLLKEENGWLHLQVPGGLVLLIDRARVVRMEVRA